MYATKEIIADKFWIVESRNGKVGTIRKVSAGYEFFNQSTNTTSIIDSLDDFKTAEVTTDTGATKTCNGFPTSSASVVSVEHDTLPVFKKTATANTLFAAGYYIIKFKDWLPSFTPKLSTLESNEFQGPFLTEWDMNLNLKRAKRGEK